MTAGSRLRRCHLTAYGTSGTPITKSSPKQSSPKQALSGTRRWTTWQAERLQSRGLGAAPPFLGALWDQGVLSARSDAEARGGPRSRLGQTASAPVARGEGAANARICRCEGVLIIRFSHCDILCGTPRVGRSLMPSRFADTWRCGLLPLDQLLLLSTSA